MVDVQIRRRARCKGALCPKLSGDLLANNSSNKHKASLPNIETEDGSFHLHAVVFQCYSSPQSHSIRIHGSSYSIVWIVRMVFRSHLRSLQQCSRRPRRIPSFTFLAQACSAPIAHDALEERGSLLHFTQERIQGEHPVLVQIPPCSFWRRTDMRLHHCQRIVMERCSSYMSKRSKGAGQVPSTACHTASL